MKIGKTSRPEDLAFIMMAHDYGQKHIDKVKNKGIGVLIVKNDIIVGRGYRKTIIHNQDPYFDTVFHAEQFAIAEAGDSCRGATLYTTLEPCSLRNDNGYEGDANVPEPCCIQIVESGIKRVVIGIMDTDFGSGGSQYLLEHGVEVLLCEGMDREKFEALTKDFIFPTGYCKDAYEEFIRRKK